MHYLIRYFFLQELKFAVSMYSSKQSYNESQAKL